MRVLKLKSFSRWARKEKLPDTVLAAAADEMRCGLVKPTSAGGW